MIRAIIAVLFLAAVIYGGWGIFKASTWKERWNAFRTMSGLIVVLAVSVLTLALIVQLF